MQALKCALPQWWVEQAHLPEWLTVAGPWRRVFRGASQRASSWVVLLHPCMHAKLLQLCLTLCDAMDCSPPGSSVHGIFQARILEWIAMPPSRRSSWPRNQTLVSGISCTGRWVLYTSSPPGKPPKTNHISAFQGNDPVTFVPYQSASGRAQNR